MNRIIITIVFLFNVLLNANALSAAQTPNQVLNAVYQKLMKVNDYSVEANIRSDIPLIKIMPVNAKIYFKQKDKFKVESKSIAILPKQSFTDFSKILKDTLSYMAVFAGTEIINSAKIQIINLIPNEDTGDLILAKLWIDTEKNLTIKSQLTTRSNGTMLVQYFYNKVTEKYGLPDSMVFTVDVKKFKIPKAVAADLNKSSKPDKKNDNKNKKGQIYIRFKNYQINKGIDDKVFTKK
jgi:outer membrane lipoprotein-sorting protein